MKRKILTLIILVLAAVLTLNVISIKSENENNDATESANTNSLTDNSEVNSGLDVLTDAEENLQMMNYSNAGLTDMNNITISANNDILHLEGNEISKIDNLQNLEHVKEIFLYDNKISTIENIETIPSEQFKQTGVIWLDDSIDSITLESYEYLKNSSITIHFLKEGETPDSYNTTNSKTIYDLTVI